MINSQQWSFGVAVGYMHPFQYLLHYLLSGLKGYVCFNVYGNIKVEVGFIGKNDVRLIDILLSNMVKSVALVAI